MRPSFALATCALLLACYPREEPRGPEPAHPSAGDRDVDGVPDHLDACPNRKGTSADTSGCPRDVTDPDGIRRPDVS